jgi:hypothetical protein
MLRSTLLQSGNVLVVVVISSQDLITSLSVTIVRRRSWRREINRKNLSCCLLVNSRSKILCERKGTGRGGQRRRIRIRKKASCGAVSLVSTSSDSVVGTESELERQEVKVKDRKMKKEGCVETGKEESLENKKQIDTSVSEALFKVLEIFPEDTKAFLQPALAPPETSKKREPEKVPSQVQGAKKSKSLTSVAVADGVSLGHIDFMVAQLNKGIFLSVKWVIVARLRRCMFLMSC